MSDKDVFAARDEFVKAGVIFKIAKDKLDLGYEWAAMGPDEIDERVHTHIDRLVYSDRYQGPLTVLDLGCAQGTRIARFAQTGLTCIGVDLFDWSAEIAKHNQALKQKDKPALTFRQNDIRDLKVEDFAGQEFVAINCSLVMHFMERDDILHLLDFIQKIATPKTLITLSLNTDEPTSPIHNPTFKMLWDERKRYIKMIGYKPSTQFNYRRYAPMDIAIAMQMSGLSVHEDVSKENGVSAFVGSTQGGPLFEPRSEMGFGRRVINYLKLDGG